MVESGLTLLIGRSNAGDHYECFKRFAEDHPMLPVSNTSQETVENEDGSVTQFRVQQRYQQDCALGKLLCRRRIAKNLDPISMKTNRGQVYCGNEECDMVVLHEMCFDYWHLLNIQKPLQKLLLPTVLL